MKMYKLLTKKEELELFEQYKATGDRKAYERLFESQVRLAKLVVFKDFGQFKFLHQDMVSEAYIIIDTAIKMWMKEKNCRLSTLVGTILHNNLRKYVRKNFYAINMPQNADLPDWVVHNEINSTSLDHNCGPKHVFSENVDLSCLTDNERYIIEEIFLKYRSNVELAAERKVSKQAISYAKRRALQKLKEYHS